MRPHPHPATCTMMYQAGSGPWLQCRHALQAHLPRARTGEPAAAAGASPSRGRLPAEGPALASTVSLRPAPPTAREPSSPSPSCNRPRASERVHSIFLQRTFERMACSSHAPRNSHQRCDREDVFRVRRSALRLRPSSRRRRQSRASRRTLHARTTQPHGRHQPNARQHNVGVLDIELATRRG